MASKLYLVATPIGNLQDITLRALETLRSVDLIAAEDTRHAAILLRHYDIHKPTVSYHDFNERNVAPQLVAQMQEGKSIALITDAGTPGISDPGFYLVRAALAENIIVEAISGPSACLAAITISGLPCDRFVFEGFPPAKKGRQTFFQNLAHEARTIVLYEAPQRVPRTLQDILSHWGDRRMALARELTKIHEEVKRGRVSAIIAGLQDRPLKGECVLVVEGRPKEKSTNDSAPGD
ncbi:16S rRNA (cytidine(1402)-2'-O)-methyltransferase [candidate division KSB1 bacterium]|nr:16S rRNA (cytidine(1402)-2'-O)-methyltransferase [candidate division KSB1 bacterium]